MVMKNNMQENKACNGKECDILEFMAKDVGMTVLHPGGFKATDRLMNWCGINTDAHVLDIACGKGSGAVYISKKSGCRVTGIDLDHGLLEEAKKQIKKGEAGSRLSFYLENAENLSFKDNTFDVTIFQAALVLIGDVQKAIKEAVRVTKRGGKIGLLELTWLKKPAGEVLESAVKDICAACMTRALPPEGWIKLLENNGLALKHTQSFNMEFKNMMGDEGPLNMVKIMKNILFNSSVRKRVLKINKFFEKYNSYLGYGIYVAEKIG